MTELVSDHLLRLPFYSELSEDQQENIVGAIREFCVQEGAAW